MHQLGAGRAELPQNWIPISEPWLGEEETSLVLECLRSGWISARSPFVGRFERAFADRCSVGSAVAVASGTGALHLIAHALGIGPGDEVIVPTLTFVATANAMAYTGARVVLADSEPDTWCVDPVEVERNITARTKAVVGVHLYGHPCNAPVLADMARRHGIALIEDAAEAHFSEIGGRPVGSFGAAAAFSFYANKTITTGEGGMVTTDDLELAQRIRYLAGNAQDQPGRYFHSEVGFNYRLTGLQAAVGLAQLGRADAILGAKQQIAAWYDHYFRGVSGLTRPPRVPGFRSTYWLYSILVGAEKPGARDALIDSLAKQGIETRPFFEPLHRLPPYKDEVRRYPVAEDICERGLSLPSFPKLTQDHIRRISEAVIDGLA